jgi:hypothetical protein
LESLGLQGRKYGKNPTQAKAFLEHKERTEDVPKNVFASDFRPYGSTKTKGEGTPGKWKAAFDETMSEREAQDVLSGMSPWDVLGIVTGASETSFAAITKAFRELAKIHHPDHGGDAKEFRKIMAAYSQLKRFYEAEAKKKPKPKAKVLAAPVQAVEPVVPYDPVAADGAFA